jgi:hypothetical protein
MLDFLSAAPAVATLAAAEFGVDLCEVNGVPRREALDERKCGQAMRFTGGAAGQARHVGIVSASAWCASGAHQEWAGVRPVGRGGLFSARIARVGLLDLWC